MRIQFKIDAVLIKGMLSIFLMSFFFNVQAQLSDIKRNINFNEGWKFLNNRIENVEKVNYDDSQWRTIDLPHDISVEDLPVQDSTHIGPFFKGKDNSGDVGFLKGGTAWYRKHFTLEQKDQNKQVIINFDGIQSEAIVFINGIKIAEHKYGYTPFNLNITPYLTEAGEENIIAIKVINPENNSRWFAGFGIYRDVNLSILNPVHINDWGVFITTSQISQKNATIKLAIQTANSVPSNKKVELKAEIIAPNKSVVKTKTKKINIPSNGMSTTNLEMTVANPILWDLESPNLYTAKVMVYHNKQQVDEYVINFGIRSISYSVEKGFVLNGKEVLLKGACIHHDNGLLGAAAFKRAEYRKVEIMKKNGYNAIRTSHNPPSKLFLDACDELGMLVIDEAFDMWEQKKRKNDYHLYFNDYWEKDIESMMLRDRNHPSIIMWSYGNEISERAKSRGIEIAKMLVNKIKKLDDSRPTTQAICHFWDNPDQNWEEHSPAAFEVMDIAGYNYKYEKYESDHKLYPNRIMYGSESIAKDAFENWKMVEKHPYVIGDFVWTGMDYLGESGIGYSEYQKDDKEEWMSLPGWPWFNAWCGDIDLIGNKKPQSLYRDVVWHNSELEILVHEPIPVKKFEHISYWGWPKELNHWNWTGKEGDTLSVNVYSSCSKVKLELNGKIIGEKKIDQETGITATFKVPYQKGELKATGIKTDNTTVSKILKTAGKPAKLILKTERHTLKADRNEIVYIHVSVVDSNNNIVPISTLAIEAEVTGEGELIAAGNSNPHIEGSIQDNLFNLYNGRGLVIIRSNGKTGMINLSVKAENNLNSQIQIVVD